MCCNTELALDSLRFINTVSVVAVSRSTKSSTDYFFLLCMASNACISSNAVEAFGDAA